MSDPLSRRERQIMDLVYRFERATVGEIHAAMHEPPTYNAVRALMGTLVDKGHLAHERDGRRYVYFPTVPAAAAGQSALRRVVTSFFDGSPAQAALALLQLGDEPPDERELAALEAAIQQAREEGR